MQEPMPDVTESKTITRVGVGVKVTLMPEVKIGIAIALVLLAYLLFRLGIGKSFNNWTKVLWLVWVFVVFVVFVFIAIPPISIQE